MKNNIKYRYILSFILLFYVLAVSSNVTDNTAYDYGLTFTAHSTNQDQRTTLDLTPHSPLSFPEDGFTLSFDIKLRNELYTYGYVVRVIADDSSCFDFISYLLYSRFNIVLTDKDRSIRNTEIVDSLKIVADKWLHVELCFTKDKIHIVTDDIQATINHSLESFKNIKICFGSSKHAHFFSTDVPPMTIRNVSIANQRGEALYKWDLATHDQKGTFDSVKRRQAIIHNGVWEIDKHTKWTKLRSLKVSCVNPQIAYDDSSGRFFVVDEKMLYIYHVKTNLIDSIAFNGHPLKGASSQVVYDSRRNRLISYSPDREKLNIFDFEQASWTLDSSIPIDTRQHHNRFIDLKRDELIVFGGYGNHRYNAQLSRICLQEPAQWQISALDSCIYPRYLSAMGQMNEDELLIMGGYGNRSGKQEESPGNFYDLYRLNLSTGKCVKLWEFVNEKDHFTFGNSLIADTVSNSIYALTYNNDRYNTFVYLSRFDLQAHKPVQKIMSDSILYNFLDIRSYCDMFLHRETSSIYTVIVEENEPGMSKVEFYKLAFPPLSKEDISPQLASSSWPIIPITGVLLFILTGMGGIVYYIQKKKKAKVIVTPQPITNDLLMEETATPMITTLKAKRTSSVLLLGGFQIFDGEGNNITGDFTPTLKQLFLFLLLNSIKNGKGTTSQCLDETFWFDMSKSSASNNRNVNIRKLRLIIDKIGDIHITNRNGYWYLELGSSVTCDYQLVMGLLSEIKNKSITADKKILSEIVSWAMAGTLLPNVSVEWIDEYKSAYYVLLTEVLLSIVKRPDMEKDHRLLLQIADVILLVDNIDEDAIHTKCKVLYQTGQKGLSKQCFNKFCVEYERLLNAKPAFTYEDIIHSL